MSFASKLNDFEHVFERGLEIQVREAVNGWIIAVNYYSDERKARISREYTAEDVPQLLRRIEQLGVERTSLFDGD